MWGTPGEKWTDGAKNPQAQRKICSLKSCGSGPDMEKSEPIKSAVRGQCSYCVIIVLFVIYVLYWSPIEEFETSNPN